jgi:hypothetical protein
MCPGCVSDPIPSSSVELSSSERSYSPSELGGVMGRIQPVRFRGGVSTSKPVDQVSVDLHRVQ